MVVLPLEPAWTEKVKKKIVVKNGSSGNNFFKIVILRFQFFGILWFGPAMYPDNSDFLQIHLKSTPEMADTIINGNHNI